MGFFFKDDFLKTVKAKVIIITRYVQSNETVPKVMVTFDLSTNVGYFGVQLIYQNKVNTETIMPIELKFIMKTPYDKYAKMSTNYLVTRPRWLTCP